MRQTAFSLLLAITGLLVSPQVLAADATNNLMNRGALLGFSCAGCHGVDGVSTGPATPSIAGMTEATLTDAMQKFKKGERPATVMGRIAKGYSDDDIKLMATFFSQQKFVPAKQEFNTELANKGKEYHQKYCAMCHMEGGTKDIGGSGILAGQWKPYLEIALADVDSGARVVNPVMVAQLAALKKDQGDDGIKALIEYYASQQ